jgi:hypothetical protein
MSPHVHTDFAVPLLVVAEVKPTSEVGASIGRSYVVPIMCVMICVSVGYQEGP